MSYNKYLEITNVIEFENSLKDWLKITFSDIKLKTDKISAKAEAEEFDKNKFFKDRFIIFLDNNLENSIREYTGDTNKLISIIFDRMVKILIEIRFNERDDPFLKFEELYEALHHKLVRIKDSSEIYTLVNTRFVVLSDTFIFIKQNIVSNEIALNWINQNYWTDYYDNIFEKKTKYHLRNLLLLLIMIKNREERLKKMDIKQFNPKRA